MAQENRKGKADCESSLHNQHLCYFVAQGFHLADEDEYNAMIKKPRFKCRHCGRAAGSDKNLCEPVKL